MRRARTTTLLQSTSLIFALIAVLPLLTFAYTLQRLDAIRETQYQAALAFALGVASDSGLLLERNREREGITYRRVLSIEPDTMPRVAG